MTLPAWWDDLWAIYKVGRGVRVLSWLDVLLRVLLLQRVRWPMRLVSFITSRYEGLVLLLNIIHGIQRDNSLKVHTMNMSDDMIFRFGVGRGVAFPRRGAVLQRMIRPPRIRGLVDRLWFVGDRWSVNLLLHPDGVSPTWRDYSLYIHTRNRSLNTKRSHGEELGRDDESKESY